MSLLPCFGHIVPSFVDVEKLNNVDVLEEVLEDWVMGLMAQIHDGNTPPDQQGNDYAVTSDFWRNNFVF